MKTNQKTKLTLTCDPAVIKEAKVYAAQEEESLSWIVEEFLTTYARIKKNKLSGKYAFHEPEIENLSGSFKLGKHRNYKKEFKA